MPYAALLRNKSYLLRSIFMLFTYTKDTLYTAKHMNNFTNITGEPNAPTVSDGDLSATEDAIFLNSENKIQLEKELNDLRTGGPQTETTLQMIAEKQQELDDVITFGVSLLEAKYNIQEKARLDKEYQVLDPKDTSGTLSSIQP